ncbi:MAG: hypothetical protein R3A51_00130 [Nannocystaceae bacterium]|nr:hypothetical protein [Myxococcales bacterium]
MHPVEAAMILLAAVLAAVVFTLGLLIASMAVSGVTLRGALPGVRTATLAGLASAGLGKLLGLILAFLFLPIVLLGPLGSILVQSIANVIVLFAATWLTEDLRVEPRRTRMVLAVVLAVFQVVAQRAL